MSVRAKFKVDSITRMDGKYYSGNPKEVQSILLTPVMSSKSNEENSKFYAATPAGRIELTIVNKEVGDSFELGKEYYIDFNAV